VHSAILKYFWNRRDVDVKRDLANKKVVTVISETEDLYIYIFINMLFGGRGQWKEIVVL